MSADPDDLSRIGDASVGADGGIQTDASAADIDLAHERAAVVLGQIPEYIWDGESLPVPVEEIAASWFHLHVRDVDGAKMAKAPGCPPLDPGQELAGLLLTGPREIWVNAFEANRWPGRRRFTICHELGHWNLHRSGQQSLFCRHGHMGELHPDQLALDLAENAKPPPTAHDERLVPPAELEANAFAAELLMPADLLRHHLEHTTRDISRLRQMFGTSEKAIVRRLAAVAT